ncbi:oligosaccharide flippase family protein [Frigidibacter sp. RF13]|uniref:oligosaccharide flippase family protein n=1 Tax=Frigidibacter sp. RF13 TaxID=2997340 RepID=UPI0022704B32|nr:oligosaccharide flippase family protein [Frigidibacter sp. RF13]MCY1126679.1 oligosaccharide flippase family protein [Frigidibacter sp. RF13]
MSVNRAFGRGVAWMAAGNWLEQAVNFAVFVVLARLLGARDYGLLAMASVFIVLSESLVRESLSEYLIAAREAGARELNATFWLLVGLGAGLGLSLWAIAPFAAQAYGEPEVATLIRALAPSVLIVALNAVPVAILRRDLAFRILAIRAVAGVILGGITGIGMALAGFGVWSFVGQWLVLITTNAVLAWGAVSWRPGLKVRRADLALAATFGGQVLGLRAGELAATQVPTLVIGATLGPEATGLYAVAWRLVETLSFLIVTPLRQASQSAFAVLMRQGGDAGALLLDLGRLTGAVAIPFFAGLSVLAAPMIALVFGAGWAGAAPVLTVLAAMGVYICIARVQVAFCLAAGRAATVALLAWGAALLMAGLIWIAARFGIVAVAGAVVAAHLLLWPFYFRAVAQIAGRPALGFAMCHLMPLAGAGIMALAVLAVVQLPGATHPLNMLAAAVPAGVVVYLGFAFAAMRDRFALFMRVVRGEGA